ncbi:unnamed protein product [Rotaria sp. Silwood1]|nr:unnamed protein product [Rotaria sp. Silwood1]
MLFIVIFVGFYASTAELVSSIPCEYITDEKLLCRQTSFIDSNIPLNNKSIYSHIKHIEWIESGAYILSNNLFHLFSNLKNVSLRSNAIISLSILPFWHHLKHIYHLDLSQNRLISINNRDFQSFHNLISLNVSFNFLTAIEPIWLLIPLQTIDLSQNGINTVGYVKIHNGTLESNSCSLEQIYLNDNRGLLSFSQLQTTIMNVCPFVDRFQLMNNHWHCACSDLVNSLKHYRTLILMDEPSQTLTGQCETPLPFRNIDIQKINEELVCNHLALFDSLLNDEQSQSSSSLLFSRQIIFLFLIGCIIGLIIGLCLHYCARRCHDLLFYILFKCSRQKVINERHLNESIQMADTNHNQNHFMYCPTIEPDSLPSYSQVMNDILYLDIISRQQQQHHNELDGEC